ncbi:MAG: hypothetical protein ACRC8P_00715, partial [Spiroplasma sp.]
MISLICKVLKITHRSYYQWCIRGKPTYKRVYNEKLAKTIINLFTLEQGFYGYPRIHIKLEKQFKVSAPTI